MEKNIYKLCGERDCPIGPLITAEEFNKPRLLEIARELQELGKELREMGK